MDNSSNHQDERVGLPPGHLVYVGDKTEVKIRATCCDLAKGAITPFSVEELPGLKARMESGEKLWINIFGLHDTEFIGEIGKAAGISAMIMEDVVNAEHPPKFDFDEHAAIFITKVLLPSELEDEYDFEEDHFVVVFTQNLIISFQESDHSVMNPVYKRVQVSNSRIQQRGVDYLAYALIDTVADSHLEHVRKIRDDIEDLELSFIENPDRDIQKKIHEMRGGISELRRAVWPFRDAVASMISTDYRGVDKKTFPFIRDTLDHLNTCSMILDSNREMLTNMRDWQLASISNKMNEVMKVLTIIATIFIPLTFIAGVYGMNFRYMPELEWRWSYPVLWIVMAGIFIGMLIFFWRKKWF